MPRKDATESQAAHSIKEQPFKNALDMVVGGLVKVLVRQINGLFKKFVFGFRCLAVDASEVMRLHGLTPVWFKAAC